MNNYKQSNGRVCGQTGRWLNAIRFFLLAAVFVFHGSVSGQSKKELERKKEQLRQDIEYTNTLLSQTKKNKSASLSQLIALNQKISYRSELILSLIHISEPTRPY